MKKTILAVAATTLAIAGLAAPAASAATSTATPPGYAKMQTGVTYTVYAPTYTAGLPAKSVKGNAYGEPSVEENLVAVYTKKGAKNFTMWEGNPLAQDVGVGAEVLTSQIGKAKATIVAYCDPRLKRACLPDDVARVGGHLSVTLPAGKGLKETNVVIETVGPKALSAAQLVKIAKSLAPVG